MSFNTWASDEITPSQHAANKYLDLKDAHAATLKAHINHGKESDEYKAAHANKENAFKAHEEATSTRNSAEKHMHRMGIDSSWHHRTPTKTKTSK